jgi:hypothetical protein
MSYCLKGSDSDVHAFYDRDEQSYKCRDCTLSEPPTTVSFSLPHGLRTHLGQHMAAGHRVPLRALQTIYGDVEHVDTTVGERVTEPAPEPGEQVSSNVEQA